MLLKKRTRFKISYSFLDNAHFEPDLDSGVLCDVLKFKGDKACRRGTVRLEISWFIELPFQPEFHRILSTELIVDKKYLKTPKILISFVVIMS